MMSMELECFFLPRDPAQKKEAIKIIETACTENDSKLLGWRNVPINPSCLGKRAEKARPEIKQAFIKCDKLSGQELERKLFIIRKLIEKKAANALFAKESIYPVSLSSRTIVYKGMFCCTPT